MSSFSALSLAWPSAPRVQEIVEHYEVLQLKHHPSCPNIPQQISNGDASLPEDDLDKPVDPVTPRRKNSPGTLQRYPSSDYLPSRVENFLR